MIILFPNIDTLALKNNNNLISETALSTVYRIAYSNNYKLFDEFIVNNSCSEYTTGQ